MATTDISIELTDCAETHEAVALIVPLGIETEFQEFQTLEAPAGWSTTIVAEARTGLHAAVLVPPTRTARARLLHTFTSPGSALSAEAYLPENTAVTTAAADLANEARSIASRAGGGLAGISAIVADTSARFEYGQVPMEQRWYYGQDSVPIVACTAGNCIDINTYLVAALRAADYEAAYITCYFFDDEVDPVSWSPQHLGSRRPLWAGRSHPTHLSSASG